MVRKVLFFLILSLVLISEAAGQASVPVRDYFEVLCRLSPRPPGSEKHRLAREYLRKELARLGWQVRLHTFTYENPFSGVQEGTNIIAILPGKEKKAVAFASHWDTRPVCDRDPDIRKREKNVFGANDGNSSTAVLLSLARELSSVPRGEHTVILYFFDAEDSGRDLSTYIIGSRRLVEEEETGNIVFGILVDMIGDRDLALPYEEYSYRAVPGLVRRVWDYARDKKGLSFFRNETGPAVWDDHMPFLEKGIPFICLIDFTYPWWHTDADTPDKCSVENMGRILWLLYDIARSPALFYSGF
ncbi:MAG TPA: M28 family peptidase [Candidatus Mcinerneyibacteriales bacterium]|nr:M28 family peptidase [Candidatus Mcinerneyibacteriales bacterium]HPJ70646.1 M28 family peptidase [Candidatus Mcinerneyibacteriales bacterium]HPQ88661.1 M28 family peptidase [Candidatus Mcinerneyibacteriales bacterium]